MEFRGNFKDFSIAQLLNLVHLARKTGVLLIKTGESRVRLVFTEGRLAYARNEAGKSDLAEILRQARLIDFPRFRSIRDRQETLPENELGFELAVTGVLSQAAIQESIRQYSAALIRQMFSWNTGEFDFQPDAAAPQGKILLNLPLDEFIAEGINSLSEREQLRKDIPNLDVELVFTDQPETITEQISLGGPEWQIISNINSHHTLSAIAAEINMNEDEIRRVVSGLVRAGVVQIHEKSDIIKPAENKIEKEREEKNLKKFVTQLSHKFISK